LLESIRGIYCGDKGEIVEAFATKSLYVLRAKHSATSIKMAQHPAFCNTQTGCAKLTLPIVRI